MKIILSAAALLAALSAPVVAGEVTPATQPQAQAVSVPQVVPSATAPEMSEAQPAAVSESPSQAASEGGCGHARKAVYLTN